MSSFKGVREQVTRVSMVQEILVTPRENKIIISHDRGVLYFIGSLTRGDPFHPEI